MASFIPYAPDSAFAEPSVDVTSTATTGSAADTARTATESVSIIFTNDVHSAIDASEGSALGYAGVAAFVEDAEAQYGETNVTLVDAGDAVQGGLISTVTNGEANIAIMNQVGYDYAAPGNHEFDYGMDQFHAFDNTLNAPYLSCNFVKTDSGTNQRMLDAYDIATYENVDDGNPNDGDDGLKVAFVGITTPETLTSSTPTNFQDGNGTYIYGFCGDNLAETIQNAVNDAKNEGADYVVAVGHLGRDYVKSGWSSTDIIENTSGIDAFIDGHSHQVYADTAYNNEGNPVLIAQTGTKLANIGELTITPGAADGQDIAVTVTSASDYTKTDPDIASYIAGINNQYAEEFNETVGTTDFPLVSTDSADNQIVRYQETNLGDFIADAIRESLDAEVAFINGGGVRSNLDAGNITKADLISTQPFSNNLSLIETSGQSILDALELGASKCPEADGGFLQVSGLTYTINTAIPSSVVVDENEAFVRVDGQRRVSNVKINGVDIDPQKTYRVASINYLLFEGGNGMTMFNDATVINRDAMVDNQALVNYLESMPDNKIPATYQDPSGNGRITIVSETPEEGGDTPTDPSDPTTDPSDTPTDPSDPTTDPNAGGSDSDDNAANGQAEGLPQTGDDSLQIIVPLVATNALSGAALMALALLFARKCNTVRKTRQRIL